MLTPQYLMLMDCHNLMGYTPHMLLCVQPGDERKDHTNWNIPPLRPIHKYQKMLKSPSVAKSPSVNAAGMYTQRL